MIDVLELERFQRRASQIDRVAVSEFGITLAELALGLSRGAVSPDDFLSFIDLARKKADSGEAAR